MGLIPQEQSESVARLQLSYIRPYHREIARRLVLGQNAARISRELGMSQSRLSIIINSPLFKMELKRLEEQRDIGVSDIGKTLKELSPIALETIERTMYSASTEKLRFDAASTVLDRAGYGAINKQKIDASVNVNTSYSNMTEDELRRLVSERVKRIQSIQDDHLAEMNAAEAIEVEFDCVEDHSSNEQKVMKIAVLD